MLPINFKKYLNCYGKKEKFIAEISNLDRCKKKVWAFTCTYFVVPTRAWGLVTQAAENTSGVSANPAV